MKTTPVHLPRHIANTSKIVVAVTALMLSNFGCAEEDEARRVEARAKAQAATEVASKAARDAKSVASFREHSSAVIDRPNGSRPPL